MARLREALDGLGATAEDLQTLELRAKLLKDELAARLADETNRNLYLLSVISAILLPMTLISGIFGMNLGGIPGGQWPFGFATGTLFILCVGVLTAIVLRCRKIL
jgi:zinc transporter